MLLLTNFIFWILMTQHFPNIHGYVYLNGLLALVNAPKSEINKPLVLQDGKIELENSSRRWYGVVHKTDIKMWDTGMSSGIKQENNLNSQKRRNIVALEVVSSNENVKVEQSRTRRSWQSVQLKSNKKGQNYNGNDAQQTKCSPFGSCLMNEGSAFPVCYCDRFCQMFEDCCFDAKIDIQSHQHGFDEEDKKRLEDLECNLSNRLCKLDDNTMGYFFIQRCPTNYTDLELAYKCESTNLTHPVSSDDDGVSYSNEYCAICNNVTKYRHWNVRIHLDRSCRNKINPLEMNITDPTERLRILKENCAWSFVPNRNGITRICRNAARQIKTCPVYMNPLTINKKVYRNIFCIPDALKTKTIKCLQPQTSFEEKNFKIQPLTVLFHSYPPLVLRKRKMCGGKDAIEKSGLCVPKDCRDWNLQHQCELEAYDNYELTIPTLLTSDRDRYHVLRAITAMYVTLPSKYNITIKRIYGGRCCHLSDCINEVLIVYKLQRRLSIDDIRELSYHLRRISWSYKEMINGTTITTRFNSDERTHCGPSSEQITDFAFIEKNFLQTFNLMHTNITPSNKIPLFIKIVSKLEISPKTNEIKKISILKVCSKYRSKINVIRSEGRMFSSAMGSSSRFIQGMITYICMVISCICLVVTMGIYLFTGMTKSPPGTFSLHMMFSLLLAQVLFLTGISATDHYYLCLCIGALSHYLWLTTFVWVCIFMFHVTRSLAKIKHQPNTFNVDSSQLSVCNYIIGYGGAWLLVVPSVISDLTQNFDVNIDYTSNVCFPTGYPGNLLVFTGPILCCLLINCIMLFSVAIIISKHLKSIYRMSIAQNKSYVIAYIKLCFISSVPWLSGVLGDVLHCDVLNYIFVLLAGSQGIIVSLSFLSSRKLIIVLKDAIKQKLSDRSSPVLTSSIEG